MLTKHNGGCRVAYRQETMIGKACTLVLWLLQKKCVEDQVHTVLFYLEREIFIKENIYFWRERKKRLHILINSVNFSLIAIQECRFRNYLGHFINKKMFMKFTTLIALCTLQRYNKNIYKNIKSITYRHYLGKLNYFKPFSKL